MAARSIKRRFVVPVVAVLAAALTLSAGITAVWLERTVRRRDEQRLARVVAALTVPGFPLNEPVLDKMSALSGAEFVVVDAGNRPSASSLPLASDAIAQLVPVLAEPRPQPNDVPAAVQFGERHFLAEAIELPPGNAAGKRLIVLSPAGQFWTNNGAVVLPPLVVGLAALVVLIALVSAIARHTARPIEQLAAHAQRIAAGDFSRCATQTACQELDMLASAMNDMAERLRGYADRIRRNERLRTLDQLSGGVAHQLRNAATGARLALDLYRRDPDEREAESLEIVDRQLQHIEACCQRFLSLARGAGPPTEPRSFAPINLAELVREACAMVAPLVRHAGASLDDSDIAPQLELVADTDSLRQVIVNLLVNAVEAVRHPDVLEKRLAVELKPSHDGLLLRVGDNGPGPSSSIADVFEPLISDKAGGTGLGLAVAREVVTAHGGRISWLRGGSWTWFEVCLPTGRAATDESLAPVAAR